MYSRSVRAHVQCTVITPSKSQLYFAEIEGIRSALSIKSSGLKRKRDVHVTFSVCIIRITSYDRARLQFLG